MVTPGGLVVLTDRRIAAGPLVSVVRAAVDGGAAWVVLREKDLPYAERAALADSLRAVVPDGRLIVAGLDPLGGDAVHLAEADPLPTGDMRTVGRSCHGVPVLSIEDYVTLSPIYPTPTKPGYGPPLGTEAAARIAAAGRRVAPPAGDVPRGPAGGVPWLALGGVDSAERAAACAAAGAAGIAVMGAVMRAGDPAAVAAELAAAFAGGRDPARPGASAAVAEVGVW
ncbi:thiamine phosphate synthase [Actinoplanes sp. URMC 104]|uniref:thiamine phosphate synthase n=1 Tax=Actinoplanes sp. URMC 104 TaxID=3423409 RepID=UPI003F1CD164